MNFFSNMPYTSECIYSRTHCLHVYERECTLFLHWHVPTLLSIIMLGITIEATLAKSPLAFMIIYLNIVRLVLGGGGGEDIHVYFLMMLTKCHNLSNQIQVINTQLFN